MPVTKSTRECYEIRDSKRAGEWANITLSTWRRVENFGTEHERTNYGGEIVIHSSYGTWGNIWFACAVPFKEFLQHVEFDYAFGKFMGSDLQTFDGDKSLRKLRRKIIDYRKRTELTREGARALWNELWEQELAISSSPDSWILILQDIAEDLHNRRHRDAAKLLSEPWEEIKKSPRPCAVNFWQQLWPIFIEALKAETTLQLEPEEHAA